MLSIMFIYLFFGFLLFIFQRKIVFNVSGLPKKPTAYGLNNIKEFKIITKDGVSLLSWYSKPKINKPTLLYFHGNSFDIGERAYRIERYISQGWGVLMPAWRGYSGNLGNPTEQNLYIDAESSLDWLHNNTLTNKKDIILYGESLGTGVAIEIATRYLFKSLILEAPFTSIYEIALKRYKIYPFKFLVLDKFNNLQKINKINTPLLIISGKKDEIVPHQHSIELFNKAKTLKERLFLDEAMHNNLYDFDIDKRVIEFSS